MKETLEERRVKVCLTMVGSCGMFCALYLFIYFFKTSLTLISFDPDYGH